MNWDKFVGLFNDLPGQGETALEHVKIVSVDAWSNYPGVIIIAGVVFVLVVVVRFFMVRRKLNKLRGRIKQANEAYSETSEKYRTHLGQKDAALRKMEQRAQQAEGHARDFESRLTKTIGERNDALLQRDAALEDAQVKIRAAQQEAAELVLNERRLHGFSMEALKARSGGRLNGDHSLETLQPHQDPAENGADSSAAS